jgi:5-(carboxyamino)imidazole ribonucleotide synthase
MHFDPELNICTSVSAPAAVGQAVERAARKMAETCAEALDVCGILAVELILTSEGELLLNEVAPRPHNSGHLTIEAAATNQFEQHVRAIADFPLGTPRLRSPSIMINVLGSGSAGPATWRGLEDAFSVADAHPHVYGKRESRPGRKMGHITLCGPELGELRGLAEHLGATVAVSGEEEET